MVKRVKCYIYSICIIVMTIRNTWKIHAGAIDASGRSGSFSGVCVLQHALPSALAGKARRPTNSAGACSRS